MNNLYRSRSKKSAPTMRQLLVFMMVVVFVFLTVAITTIFLSGRNIVNSYMQDVGGATLNYYKSSLDYTLGTISDYCRGDIARDSAFAVVSMTEDPLERHYLKTKIGKALSSLLQISNSIHFVMNYPYNGDKDALVIRSRCDSLIKNNVIKDVMLNEIQENASFYQYNSWRWIQIDEIFYLTNIFRFDSFYCFVALDPSILLSTANVENNYYLLCRQDDIYISGDSAIQQALLAEQLDSGYLALNGSTYALLSIPSNQGNFSVCCLVTASVSTLWQSILRISAILIILFLGLSFGFSAILRRLTNFFSMLNQACVRVADGDLSTSITRRGTLAEEIKIYGVFNKMTQQIKALRINLYEQELSVQHSKTRFLSIQIKSHFFVNCLNVIHSLAIIGDPQLIQDFSLCLADYFRYLGSGFSDTVYFGSELSHLHNYVKIHQIRYPGRIAYDYSVEPELEDFEMLPMIPQTFVENSFMHALGVSDKIHFSILARNSQSGEKRGLWLEIRDDGPGFAPECLTELNRESDDIEVPSGPGTGIRNTKARLKLFYNSQAIIRFENASDHGAIVRIFFPMLEKSEVSACTPS